MLKKTKRLSTKEFQNVFQNGKRVSSPLFLVSYLDIKKIGYSVSVPKKIYKSAVDRNNIKRLIYSCLKKQEILPSFGVVIVVRKKLDNMTHKHTCDELLDVFKKI